MRRLDLTDYDPEPAPHRTCRPCLYGRHPDCRWDQCGCTTCNPDNDEEHDMNEPTGTAPSAHWHSH